MLVDKKISEYVVFETETIFRALEKINDNKKRIIFILADNGVLMGCLTDGDFRRWVTSSPDFDVSSRVSEIMNPNVSSVISGSESKDICSKFSNSIDVIPIVDSANKLVSIALKNEDGFSVGGRIISDSSPVFIIAEIGNNHNGDLGLAKRLVDLALEAGADCVKFQMRDVASLYKLSEEKDHSADLGAQYVMDILSKFQLSNQHLFEIFDYCKSKGLTPLCTPWDSKSLEELEKYGMEFYKVASADLTNHPFLEALINTGKPLICSTGMSTEIEIKQSAEFLRRKGANFALLHCNSTYPTPFKDVNLAYLKKLKNISGGLVGYSGHERGTCIPVAAIAFGAKIIEKHFTVDQSMEGNDHKVSLLPHDFKRMVSEIRAVEESIGNSDQRVITQGEMLNRESLAKSIIANRPIEEGKIITREMLDTKSPGQGLQPMYMDKLVGRVAKRGLNSGDYFFEGDLTDSVVLPRDYKFSRPFGIPVRYHDYEALSGQSNFDFVEFHLSYQDLDLNLAKFFSTEQDIDFAVHAPELFSGDHILDLTSQNEIYREHSINELQRVCTVTRQLKKFFPKTLRPVIVINAGGFSSHGFLNIEEITKRYETLETSLSRLDQSGVEIIIQTMPPFPWHFGGQSYHNLFVNPHEIKKFCDRNKYRICFDVSHSMMACSYYNWNLSEFTHLIGSYIAHMHIVDALGEDGEGVQIGQGDVCFKELSVDLSQVAHGIMFLPEVWQGHKNSGEGFWKALAFLEEFHF
jgi:N-acetylneuraminate synthase